MTDKMNGPGAAPAAPKGGRAPLSWVSSQAGRRVRRRRRRRRELRLRWHLVSQDEDERRQRRLRRRDWHVGAGQGRRRAAHTAENLLRSRCRLESGVRMGLTSDDRRRAPAPSGRGSVRRGPSSRRAARTCRWRPGPSPGNARLFQRRVHHTAAGLRRGARRRSRPRSEAVRSRSALWRLRPDTTVDSASPTPAGIARCDSAWTGAACDPSK